MQITGVLIVQVFILQSFNTRKHTWNWTFFKDNKEIPSISSLSLRICFPSCEPLMIPWRSVDTKYTILDKAGTEPWGKYITFCSVIDNIRNVASLFLGFHWNKGHFFLSYPSRNGTTQREYRWYHKERWGCFSLVLLLGINEFAKFFFVCFLFFNKDSLKVVAHHVFLPLEKHSMKATNKILINENKLNFLSISVKQVV